jgi:chitinase
MVLLTTIGFAQSKLVVGYYPSWMKSTYPYNVIQYQYLTYIAHAFIFPNSDGSLDLSGFTYYPELVQRAHMNSVGIVISVGGYDLTRTPRFAQVAASPAARTKFAVAVRDFCIQNGYDGVDIDWEYPLPAARANTTLFFRELHDSLANAFPQLTLSAAIQATDGSGAYDWSVMPSILDWVGVMTYDFYGSWTTKIGPNSPLYGNLSQTDQGWIANSVAFYLGKGVPKSKLLIGTPFYGWQFNNSTMYGPGVGTGQLTYTQIAPLLQQGWSRSWDQLAWVPYIVNPTKTNLISYDDSASVAEKMKYVKNQNLGGTIIWALGEDYVNGQSPLLTALGRVITGVERQISGVVPGTFELLQNYPNPFNGQTQIRFNVTKPGRYSLLLYDLLGREVQRLVDADLQAGSYQASCSSQNLPSGVYVYRLNGDGTSLIRTMIVLR